MTLPGNPDQHIGILRETIVALVRSDGPDLSARQLAVLLTVYLGEGPHTVRGLANDLNVSKPAITRALDRLGELGVHQDCAGASGVRGRGQQLVHVLAYGSGAGGARVLGLERRDRPGGPDDEVLRFTRAR